MRARVVTLAVLAVGLGASLVACIDLFHDTNFESACDADAAACEALDAAPLVDATPPPQDTGPAGPTNFCQWDAGTATTNATHACTWLSACEGALDDNAFGPCMVHAMLAYDCAANLNRPVLGAAHAYWDCLWQTKSCGDVNRCIEPSTQHAACNGTSYVACNQEAGTLVACAADASTPAAVESCTAYGQTCSAQGVAECLGSATACVTSGTYCEEGTTLLHDCDPDGGATDYGVDCTSFGAGSCASSGCKAVNGTPCDSTTDVTCDGGIAMGCPSGTSEQVDCNALLGQPSGTASCNATAPGRPWDVSRACSLDQCTTDSCSGTTLTACVRGASLPVDCTGQGFTKCESSPYAHCAND